MPWPYPSALTTAITAASPAWAAKVATFARMASRSTLAVDTLTHPVSQVGEIRLFSSLALPHSRGEVEVAMPGRRGRDRARSRWLRRRPSGSRTGTADALGEHVSRRNDPRSLEHLERTDTGLPQIPGCLPAVHRRRQGRLEPAHDADQPPACATPPWAVAHRRPPGRISGNGPRHPRPYEGDARPSPATEVNDHAERPEQPAVPPQRGVCPGASGLFSSLLKTPSVPARLAVRPAG
jgi:hypothetical protein